MYRKLVSVWVLTALLIFTFGMSVRVQMAKASGTIYIRADGSIDPPTAPISTADNITYFFTDNVFDEVEILKNNILLDGNGYNLQANSSEGEDGVYLNNVRNVTVTNFNLIDGMRAIYIYNCTDVDIHGNNIERGIFFEFSSSSTIAGNNITGYSIHIRQSSLSNRIIANDLMHVYIRIDASSEGTQILDNEITGTWRDAIYAQSPGNIIQNNTVALAGCAIRVYGSNNRIAENRLTDNDCGIHIDFDSRNNTVTQNFLEFNEVGLVVMGGGKNNISSNTAEHNFIGIEVESSNNLFRQNSMTNNEFNFVCNLNYRFMFDMRSNDIDTTNLVDGKSIYYLENQTDLTIDSSTTPPVGFLALKNCNNITVKNLALTNNSHGLMLADSTDCVVENCTFAHNMNGIVAFANSTSIVNTAITGNYHGLSLRGYFNTISSNLITNNTVRFLPYHWPENWYPSSLRHFYYWIDELLWYSGGIFLFNADNCTLVSNRIDANEQGILLLASSFNTFRNNTMTDNSHNFGIDPQMLEPLEWAIDPPDSPTVSPYLIHSIDDSNTVDGKPICYWVSRNGETVPSDAGYVALINCTDIIVENLALENNVQGIFMVGVSNTLVTNNTISKTRYSVYMRDQLFKSSSNTLVENTLSYSGTGISCAWATNCTIADNLLISNLLGIFCRGYMLVKENVILNHTKHPMEDWVLGRYPQHWNLDWYRPWSLSEAYPDGVAGMFVLGENTMVVKNLFRNNSVGLILGSVESRSGCLNTVRGNSFVDNIHGLNLLSGYNTLYHNNFINNSVHVFTHPGYVGMVTRGSLSNFWDNGVEGNYWSDYNGTDVDYDGIGNGSYVVPIDPWFGTNTDRYPLMGSFTEFPATSEHNVQTVCNSTISGFTFNGTAINFNVTGENGTDGFCRMRIPTALMSDYQVFVNGTEVSYNLLPPPISNSTHSYIYFTYHHSTQEVVVIPEFQSLIILPLFMTATLLAVMVYRTKLTSGHSKSR